MEFFIRSNFHYQTSKGEYTYHANIIIKGYLHLQICFYRRHDRPAPSGSQSRYGNEVNFSLTDNPGHWFDTGATIAGTRSLAVAKPGVRVNFSGNSTTVHTRTSVIYPTSAAGMPFNTSPRKGGDSVTLKTPGLYVFTCSIHPYMLGAVIVDDPNTMEIRGQTRSWNLRHLRRSGAAYRYRTGKCSCALDEP